MILAAEIHGEHGGAKHDRCCGGAEAHDVVESHIISISLKKGATIPSLLPPTIDGAHG
jgi:hypothetical protein